MAPDRDAVHRHPQHRHEKEVQRHIQNTGGGQGDEGDPGLPHAAEDRGLEVIEQDHRHPGKVDPQVQKGQGQDLLRHVEKAQQRRRQELPDPRHRRAPQQGDQDGGVDRLLHGVLIAVADGVGDDHVGPQGNADEEVHDEADDGAVGAHRRPRGGGGVAGEVAAQAALRRLDSMQQQG